MFGTAPLKTITEQWPILRFFVGFRYVTTGFIKFGYVWSRYVTFNLVLFSFGFVRVCCVSFGLVTYGFVTFAFVTFGCLRVAVWFALYGANHTAKHHEKEPA